MIRLYTAATPNGRKVSIGLEELGLAYEVERVKLDAGQQLTPSFLAKNPNNKIPVLEEDGFVVWESGAILLYLAERHDPNGILLSKDPKRRMEAIQYAFFQTGGLGPNLGRLGAQLRKPAAERNQEMVETFGDEVSRLLGVLGRVLADGRPYLAGDHSIGDVMHYPWLQPLHALQAPPLLEHPRVVAWVERCAARPAVQRGMKVPE